MPVWKDNQYRDLIDEIKSYYKIHQEQPLIYCYLNEIHGENMEDARLFITKVNVLWEKEDQDGLAGSENDPNAATFYIRSNQLFDLSDQLRLDFPGCFIYEETYGNKDKYSIIIVESN